MRVLFVGDIFGKPGRKALFEKLQGLIQAHRIDFSIANVENAAGGFGLTPQIAEEILSADIDVLTSGNHIWDKRAILPYMMQQPRLLRPCNYPAATPGTGLFIGDSRCGVRVAVLSLQGRVYMQPIDCPFMVGEAAL
jgi:calcineurin-like phosphoesterase